MSPRSLLVPFAAAALVSALTLGLAPRTAHAGPITFNTALPVHEDEIILRQQVVWFRCHEDPTPLGREVNVVAAPSVLVYGAHPRVTVFGVLPFLYKRLELNGMDGRVTRDTSGFGDMTGLLRVTAFKVDRPGETLRLAPFVGLEVPTGADDEADSLGRLPPTLQLGSGSWDPLGGAIFTWQTLQWELDVSASYQLRTEANDFDAGDEARGEASFQYRVLPWGDLDGGVPSFLYAVAETNVVWTDEHRIDGMDDPDSGGTIWYLAPGLQWVTRRTVLEAAVQVPVLQRLNGNALERQFIARVSFRANF